MTKYLRTMASGLLLAGGVVAATAQSYTIDGVSYSTCGTTETVFAPFANPDGGTSTGSYSGYVLITISGTGQSAGASYNDAFYRVGGVRIHPVWYQAMMSTGTLTGCGPDHVNTLQNKIVYDVDAGTEVAPVYLPAYRLDNTYTLVVDTGTCTPANLSFGVNDCIYGDNSGAYTVQVTQLCGPAPTVTCNDPITLWDPNHDLVDVSSAFSAATNVFCPGLTVNVTMWSDEPEVPETGDGSGRFAPDFKDERGGRGLLVRAERQGTGNGRFYVAEITATDIFGAITTQRCVVAVVPHSMSAASQAAVLAEAAARINDGTLYQHGLAQPLGPKQ